MFDTRLQTMSKMFTCVFCVLPRAKRKFFFMWSCFYDH